MKRILGDLDERLLHTLAKCELFTNIDASSLGIVLDCLAARFELYDKGEFIFSAGDPATRVGVVCSGCVRVIREDVFGNRTVMAVLSEGDIFGESLVCAKVEQMPVSVEAAEPCEILLIDYRKIISSCPSSCSFHPMMVENMLGILAEKNLMLNGKIEALSGRGTRAKLMAYLSSEAAKSGGRKFRIPLDRQELADYLAVDRSAMSAELSRMKRDGLIEFDRSDFELLKWPD